MVTLNLRKLAKAVGITNANQLVEASGLSLSAAYGLWSEKVTRIEFDTLDCLCEVLNCQPSDLLIIQKKKRRR